MSDTDQHVNPAKINQLIADVKEIGDAVAEIKTALVGKLTAEGDAPGLIHITQNLQRAVFHEQSGLNARVTAIEKYRDEAKAKFDVGSWIARTAFTAMAIALWEVIKAFFFPKGKGP